MNYNNLNNMCTWERKKAIYLLEVAENLGMNIEGYGEIAVNQNSGYTYLWLEDYNFTLYMPITCDLKKEDIWIMYTNFNNGDEIEISLDNMSLEDIYQWVEEQEKGIEEQEEQED